MSFVRSKFVAVIALCLVVFSGAHAAGMRVVPEGNRSASQPKIPGASYRRTSAGKTTFDLKYEKVRDLLAEDRKLISKIKSVAKTYGIDPIHMIGAIVGEHTYNVDAYDRLQTYYIKAATYAGSSFRFAYDGEKVSDFVERPQFKICADKTDSYELWSCRENVWEKDFRGKSVEGKIFPNDRFSKIFFQPFYAGQTFGIGQINPLTALQLTDMVARKSGYGKLNEKRAADVYEAIMKPDISLAYMAAAIRKSIDIYRNVAGMDISKNPGLTATLYNLGNPDLRAAELAAKNKRRSSPVWPRENYYGWLINDKLDELEGLL